VKRLYCYVTVVSKQRVITFQLNEQQLQSRQKPAATVQLFSILFYFCELFIALDLEQLLPL